MPEISRKYQKSIWSYCLQSQSKYGQNSEPESWLDNNERIARKVGGYITIY